jgi:hypothetical protein
MPGMMQLRSRRIFCSAARRPVALGAGAGPKERVKSESSILMAKGTLEQDLIEQQTKRIEQLTQLVTAYAAELEGCRKLILGMILKDAAILFIESQALQCCLYFRAI